MKGGSFSDFARRYSGDPVSAANGGDLGTVEKGKFVPAFESAAFALEANEISQPVETPFGWHIIQLVGKTSSTITCRHILVRVGQSDEDREAVKKSLSEIRERVKAGEDFEALAKIRPKLRTSGNITGNFGKAKVKAGSTLNDIGVSNAEVTKCTTQNEYLNRLYYAFDNTTDPKLQRFIYSEIRKIHIQRGTW